MLQFKTCLLGACLVAQMSCSGGEVRFAGSNSAAQPGKSAVTNMVVHELGSISGAIQITAQGSAEDPTGGLPRSPFSVAAPYSDSYVSLKLGLPAGIPGIPQLGGITIMPSDENLMLVPASTNQDPLYEKIYQVRLKRDAFSRIIGFDGPATEYITLPTKDLTNGFRNRIDAGNLFAPDGTLFALAYPSGFIFQFSGKNLIVSPSGIGFSTGFHGGAISMVPTWHKKAGTAKLLTWNRVTGDESMLQKHSSLRDLRLSKVGIGYAFEIGPEIINFRSVDVKEDPISPKATNPEGLAYVPRGSKHFDKDSMLIAEWTEHKIAVFEIDDDANPILSTRKVLLSNSGDAENRMYPVGSFFDSVSGDFLFSTWPNEGKAGDIIIVRGFKGSVQSTQPIANLKVFLDLNINGILDSDEPSTNTDAKGEYTFKDLKSGTYKVTLQLPEIYQTAGPGESRIVNLILGDQPTDVTGIDFLLKRK